MASENTFDEMVIPFPRWFLPIKERWAEGSVRKRPMSDEEALRIYRDFAHRGGKIKIFRSNIGDETGQMFRAFVQYESPEKDFFVWDGYSLQAKTDMSGIHEAGYPITFLGRGHRILIYKKNVFSFEGFRRGAGEYIVAQLSGYRENEQSPYYYEPYYCKIDSEVIKRRNSK